MNLETDAAQSDESVEQHSGWERRRNDDVDHLGIKRLTLREHEFVFGNGITNHYFGPLDVGHLDTIERHERQSGRQL